jgi:DNA (cytosine-5)-methyltransferase 1
MSFPPDLAFSDGPRLNLTQRPASSNKGQKLAIVDLFCGCGGLTLGVEQASARADFGLDILLAVDFESHATAVYKQNFPAAKVLTVGVETLFDGHVGEDMTELESKSLQLVGGRVIDILLAGPPCQGHSNLNNHTRRNDPKNALYERVVRSIELLEPRLAIIENVPAILNDKNGVVAASESQLRAVGYSVASAVISIESLGVAQSRKRHVLIAVRGLELDPQLVLTELGSLQSSAGTNLKSAIGDLMDVEGRGIFDTPSQASKDNLARIDWLFKNGAYDLPNDRRPPCHQGTHSYKSMYGRLEWTKAAQTITSGFGSMGQGRYVHPERPRTLTPHEAARIQGFPDYFSFSAVPTRGKLATMIGNAVPPAVSRTIVGFALQSLLEAHGESPERSVA